jgi:Integrase core domain
LCLGWSVRADKTVELALEALDMAIWRRGQMRAAGAVHHSDQGSRYTSFAFTRRLAAEGLVGNTGTVGDGLDNAMCESLIGTMKIEKLNRQPWRSVDDVRAAVFEWNETWYNRRPQALQPRLPLTPRVRDRIGFQTMRSTPTLSETRTQSLRVGEAETDRRCCDPARVSYEESECAEGHGRREEMLFSRETCRALCLGTVLTSSSLGR